MWRTAAYVDINAWKAEMAERPEGYRRCSFAATVRGDRKARAGYAFMYGGGEWRVIVNMLFARRRLLLERGHGAYSAKVFGIGRTRYFDLNRETKLSVDQAAIQPKHGVCNFMIRVKNGNLSEKVCAYWDEDALDYALAMMKRYRA